MQHLEGSGTHGSWRLML